MDESEGCFLKEFFEFDNLEVETMPKPSKKRKGVATSPKAAQKEATTASVVALEQTPTDATHSDEEGLQLEKRKPTRAPSWVWEHLTKKEIKATLKFQKAFERLHDTNGLYLMEFSFGENVSERKKGSTHVTSHMYFHDFSTILTLLNKWIGSNDPLFSTIAEKMKEKHEKYWGAASNMNVLIFIACVLDPRYKLSFVEFGFGKLYDRIIVETLSYKVKSTLKKMFEEYCTLSGFMDEDNSNSHRPSSQGKDDEAINDDFSMFADLYEEKMSMENEEDGKNEVDLYLAEDKEKKSDKFHILNWWKVNSSRYLILSLIARDVFVVPMSTVASESAFSIGGCVLDPYRSSLSPKTMEILIRTQNWFRSTPLLEKMETQEVADEIEQEIATLSNGFVDLEL
ncbi:hypothetical protein SLEP1_g53799 [Rubroshorea leprosula]|uniref:Transposase n=1 Tax=Rubroshorea leprosula TaxID=152421 RepID=A0AAV5MAF1_9ROSI|nr:hypothetical protein SLEP1_g53799 [Rubroshorea leprosula]